MKPSLKIVVAVAAVSVVAIALAYTARNGRQGQILSEVSDHGYETAFDILFPRSRQGGSNLHYGPVLPNN